MFFLIYVLKHSARSFTKITCSYLDVTEFLCYSFINAEFNIENGERSRQ